MAMTCELQPCGHPVCAIRGLPDFPSDGPDNDCTQYCGWCADINMAREDGIQQGTLDTIKALIGLGEREGRRDVRGLDHAAT